MQVRTMWGARGIALQLAVCAFFFLQDSAQAESAIVGNAVLVIGQACVQRTQTNCAPVTKGATVAEGDTVETGADGYVYITTVDHGFVSVRPDSSLTFERYEYDPADPRKTVIKLSLHKGVVREISGTGAQAARDHYRMNTPVAALGVRGTDFTVFTDANVTRADVRSGGIVMTPLGAGCTAGGAGPCEGTAAAQLFAGQSDRFLQVYRGNARPVVVDASLAPLMPEQAASALKSEENSARAVTTQPAVNPGVAPAELTFPLAPAAPVVPVPDPVPVGPTPPPVSTPQPEAQQIFWGRFAPLASLDANTTLAALVQQGGDQVALMGSFAMTRTAQTDMVMPAYGTFTFGLQAYEAYVVSTSTGAAVAAQISNPTLSIDFGASTFRTSLNLSANGSSYGISGQGSVTSDGKLVSDYGASPAFIRGALAGKNATQAGYLFMQSLDGKNTAIGATQWSRR